MSEIRRRKSKQDLPAYTTAMEKAHIGEGPQPLCHGKPEEFVDYGYPLPSIEDAELLCGPCPLLEACRANAKHRRPQWGILGGIVWVYGRQAHLMSEDDPRLRDPDLTNSGLNV